MDLRRIFTLAVEANYKQGRSMPIPKLSNKRKLNVDLVQDFGSEKDDDEDAPAAKRAKTRQGQESSSVTSEESTRLSADTSATQTRQASAGSVSSSDLTELSEEEGSTEEESEPIQQTKKQSKKQATVAIPPKRYRIKSTRVIQIDPNDPTTLLRGRRVGNTMIETTYL